MSSIKFTLKNKKSSTTSPINYYINFSQKEKLRGSTYLKIEPKYWDETKQRVRNVASLSEIKDEINKKLTSFYKFTEQKLIEYKNKNIDDIKVLLKNDIGIHLGKITPKEKSQEKTKLTFYPAIEQFIEQSKGRVIEKTGKPITKCTIKGYTRALNSIIDFEKTCKYKITFDTINLDFYFAYKDYLDDLDYAVNTIGKYIKTVRTFMNYATEQGLNTNLAYKSRQFIVPTENSEQIYLDDTELKKIIELDLTENPKLDNARDLFIIGAYTGLRVSDFNGLTKENIHLYKNERVFRVIVKKTGNYLPIPIHPYIEKILLKYNGNPPKKMKTQDINDYLSIIGEKANINKIITSKITKGGKIITNMKPKYKMIKNHTARRSFCTNAYKSGMDPLDIMAISGHKSFKTFKNYIKISDDERAIKISKTSFFNPEHKLKIVE